MGRGRALLPVACLLSAAIGRYSAELVPVADAASSDPYASLDVYANVVSHVEAAFVEALPMDEIVRRSLVGLATSLDRWSNFYDPATARQIALDWEGRFVGVGVRVVQEGNCLRVEEVVRDGPAAVAGVLPGDCVLNVDGYPATEARLYATEGTATRLHLSRGGEVLTMVTANVRVPARALEIERRGGKLLATIRQFREGVAKDLSAAIDRARPSAVVLDLRGNPGGRMDEAVAVVDLFVSDGEIVRSQGRAAGNSALYPGTPGNDFTGPVSILVNRDSASAAEIVAGSLQARKRAKILGETTFGKGLIQTWYHYPDGSALKLTTGRYLLPDGRRIDPDSPVVPDVQMVDPGRSSSLAERFSAAGCIPDADRARIAPLLVALPYEGALPLGELPSGELLPLPERLARDGLLRAGLGE